jgi:hypothetical protein
MPGVQKEDILMEITYENVANWLDVYFDEVNRNQGPLEVAVKSKKYFSEDFEFRMYTAPGFVNAPLSRERFLILFVHPGLHERLTPQYYVIDLKQMIVVVQFEIQFTDEISGTTWPPRQASAHYDLVLDTNNDLKIRKIRYWTESSAPEETAPMTRLWTEYRENALMDMAADYIKAH